MGSGVVYEIGFGGGLKRKEGGFLSLADISKQRWAQIEILSCVSPLDIIMTSPRVSGVCRSEGGYVISGAFE